MTRLWGIKQVVSHPLCRYEPAQIRSTTLPEHLELVAASDKAKSFHDQSGVCHPRLGNLPTTCIRPSVCREKAAPIFAATSTFLGRQGCREYTWSAMSLRTLALQMPHRLGSRTCTPK